MIKTDSGNTHAGHRGRLRRRFLASGRESLYEHELLELMLFYARPMINTNNIAHALISRFGSLGKVLSADSDDLRTANGVGEGGALFLKLMNDFGLSYMRRAHSCESLSSHERLCACLAEHIDGSQARICIVLCLGTRAELIRTLSLPTDEIADGSISPKELASILLKSGAASICAGINHGNAPAIPDDTDYTVTRIFAELLSAIGTGFTDCMVFGGGKCFSMRRNGAFGF